MKSQSRLLRIIRNVFVCALLCALWAPNTLAVYRIPNPNPSNIDEILQVVNGEIPADLNRAMCGGWDFEKSVNGLFEQEEARCAYSFTQHIGSKCKDNADTTWTKIDDDTWEAPGGARITDTAMDLAAARTDEDEGLVSVVEGVPGRDTEAAFGNMRAGMAWREEDGGLADIHNGQRTGFTYPDNQDTCGFTTVCRPPSHPDRRAQAPLRTHGPRDRPGFFCDHPCQRPLDGDPPTGKPRGWDPTDSRSVECGRQRPYTSNEDGIKYACGGGETKPPQQGFCNELENEGPKGGLCQDINNWSYILWRKHVHTCIEGVVVDTPVGPAFGCFPVMIYRYEKGPCGFPRELPNLPRNQNLCGDRYEPVGINECCSDDAHGAGIDASAHQVGEDDDGNPIWECQGITINDDPDHVGNSCKTCQGDDCRDYPDTNNVIVPDIWFDPMPQDLPHACQLEWDDCDLLLAPFPGGANIGPWDGPDPIFRYAEQPREYISYFREYNEASYERFELQPYTPNDDHKKEHIPVACYGMYDYNMAGLPVPEDAKTNQTHVLDKRCVIGAYYTADDGDGDEVNFASMPETQEGIGTWDENLPDNPFGDGPRPFDEENDLWYPSLSSSFSLINDKVFSDLFGRDLTFALLAPDNAKQRATVQLDAQRKLSSGSTIRAFDDTVTNDKDFEYDRRTIVEWWHRVETEMHEHFTPPTIRVLLPNTWSIDLDPLDPLYTPPDPPDIATEDVDPRMQTMEIQISAREDLLGDIVAFFERALFFRIDEAPVPVVVPIASPTELRAWAVGWDSWAKKQEENGGPGVASARDVAEKLREYSDRIDQVRAIRAELPKYAGDMLSEQKKVSKKLADWLDQNIDAYEELENFGNAISFAKVFWESTQDIYRNLHDYDAMPWCRNSRFTTPIYSMLDPWLPGRENQGDVTGGFGAIAQCVVQGGTIEACAAGNPVFAEYFGCLVFLDEMRAAHGPDSFPNNDACDQYFPTPPLLPFLEARKDPDIVVDFTAFRAPQDPIKLPVLRPIQIRIDHTQIRPPGLEDDDEPTYPDLPDLPELPDSLSTEVIDSLPDVGIFKEAAVLESAALLPAEIPVIETPEVDLGGVVWTIIETRRIINEMANEYRLFWNSVDKEPCAGGGGGADCVKQGTEQDCIHPYGDPKGKCVHFEADLKERLQRIGSRPGIFLKEDFESRGWHRRPLVHGQKYCEKEDWACQLLNALERPGREGWQLDLSEDFDQEDVINTIRRRFREESDNLEDADPPFPYDNPQEEMLPNYATEDELKIYRQIERFEPETLEPGEECDDFFCCGGTDQPPCEP